MWGPTRSIVTVICPTLRTTIPPRGETCAERSGEMAAEDVHVESSAPDENVTLTAFKLILEDVNNPSETDQHSETVFANDAAIHNEACTGSAPMPDSRPASSDYNLSDDRPRAGKDKNTVLNIGVFSRAKILCLLAVIVVVWALLLVPVVIFFIPSVSLVHVR